MKAQMTARHHEDDRARHVALGVLELARRLDHAFEADEGVEGEQDDAFHRTEFGQSHRAQLAPGEECGQDQRAQRQQLDGGHHAQRADRCAHAVKVNDGDDRKAHRHRQRCDHRIVEAGEQRREIGHHDVHVGCSGHDRAGIARPARLEADETPERRLAIKDRTPAMFEPARHPCVAQGQRQKEDPADQHHPRREIADRGDQHRGQGEDARPDHAIEGKQ